MANKRRRAYIGNLRPRPNLVENLHNDLIIPHCLPVKNYPGGDGIIVTQPKTHHQNQTSAYALIEFADVDYAIQVLNGVQFDGRVLRVSREKTNFGSNSGGGGFGRNKGGGFGSSRWAGDDDDNDRQHHRRKKPQTSSATTTTSNIPLNRQDEESIVRQVTNIVSNEIKESDDTAAVACTAAMTLLSSVDAFGLDGDDDEGANSNDEFQTRRNLPISELLAEYGEQDVHWKTNKPSSNGVDNEDSSSNVPFKSRLKPLSDLLAEYGEQDVNWKKQQEHQHDPMSSKQSNNTDNGMLAPVGKAPIHLEIMSFGYKYNAPKNSKGFSFAHPLPPIDIRDLDRAPGSVSKFNGLSYLVKRALLNPSKKNDHDNDDDNDGEGSSSETQSPMRQRTNTIADEIIKVLVEAIDEGGHSAINPLTMTVSVGSEYGRHRAVVLVEHLAVVLRARLRRNDGKSFGGTSNNNGIVKQPVSVGTRHRDVEAHHKDEEAFGEDLKRQERAAEKARRRQTDELDWDDGNSW